MNSIMWVYVLVFVFAIQADMVTAEAIENRGKEDGAHFTDFNPENLHLRMKRSELEEYFGVSSYEKVPKYEITPPFQADEDGSFLSHTLEEHARQKRETGEPRFWFYNVKAFGMSLHLNLTKNEQLMAPGMKVERHFNGTVTSEDPPKNSFLIGHVSSLAGSSVAVSNEEGLTGIIKLLDQTLFIRPIPSNISPKMVSSGKHHLVFRRSLDDKQTLQEIDPIVNKREDKPVLEKADSHKEGKMKRDVSHFNLQTMLVADKRTIKYYREMKVDITTHLLRIANMLNTIYQDPSIGSKIITIKVVRIELVENGLDYPQPGNRAKIETLKKWTNENIEKSRLPKIDVVSLISRGDVGGLADYNSICKRTSYTVNNDMGLSTVLILAHETGHTLGLDHDGKTSDCPDGKYIMSTAVPGGGEAATWSPCSKRKIESLLSRTPACLTDGIGARVTYTKSFNNKLPGKALNADMQCQLQYGKGYRQCKQRQSDCASLFCTADGYHCLSKIAPPLDGTYCAPRHWCIKGACVDDGTSKINGGWSAWRKKYEKCTRTCGGGIQWKTRTCTNPSPRNGGENCAGDSKGLYRICNIRPCPADSEEYRVTQCKVFDPSYTQIWYIGGNSACNLYCRKGFTYRPRGIVKDGTKCRPDLSPSNRDICLGGKCMPVGCDYKIGSGTAYDRCGVCNGDSTTCTPLTVTFTEDWKERGPENAKVMLVVPRKSKQIKVLENVGDRNSIGLQTTKGVYLVRPGEFGKKSVAGSEINYGRDRSRREFMHIPGPIKQGLKFVFVSNGPTNRGVVISYLKAKKSLVRPDDVQWHVETKEWSKCSESCAGGIQRRTVKCKRKDDGSIVADAVCKKASAVKPEDEKPCNTQPCPPEWHITSWSSCSTTCGHGVVTRQVTCKKKVKNPGKYEPASGCPGSKPTLLQKPCFAVPCPPEWVPGPWAKCTKTCKGGVLKRTLTCQKPHGDGKFIPVPSVFCKGAVRPPVTEPCNTDVLCKLDGGYSNWTPYSVCSRTCDVGFQFRTRLCNNPAPANGGKDCTSLGPRFQTRFCNTQSCLVRKKYRSLGCYRESPRRRLLPVLEKNFRSSMKWTAIEELVEDCYEIVKNTHYKVFGFKFYGECWVGERPEPQYKTSMDRCFLHVVGKAHSYFVYEVV
ncbi:A disintegrin and metalloproteinase with thrombospondin motifs 18-like [Porites lutea]|uniref:A disintegrin and metalloproteinase with thrombospondin motifs 18-like n=1 Tax=Porites lutea TaxID=51062 RepID=UPI003CC6A652